MHYRLLLTVALSGAITAVHLATLRPGHEWGDDFSLYVAHARNLAEGRPYAATGYIYNPHLPVLSPRSYPPGYPMLLAPVCAAFGPDLAVLKAYTVLLFGVLLLVLAWGMSRQLPWPYPLLLVAAFGLNPFLWQHKDRLLSEVPFLLFAYLSLALMELCREPARGWRGRMTLGFAAGATAYLAFATRSVGLMLVPALLGADLLRDRRIGIGSWAAALMFALGVVAQKLLLVLDSSYSDQLVFDLALFANTARSLGATLALFFENGHSRPAMWLLFAALAGLAALGVHARFRAGKAGLYECFAVLSVLLLVIWPYAAYQKRYLVTVLPVFLLLVAAGLARRWPARQVRLATGAVAVAVLASYIGAYTRVDAGPVCGVSGPAAGEMLAFVREKTPPDAVVLFQKPRALALFTGRRASALHTPSSDADLWRYLGDIRATHVIVGRPFPENTRILEGFVSRQGDRLEKVFGNDEFAVYRVCWP